MAGDIHPNPGPPAKYPCPVCARDVTSRGVSYRCTRCAGWVHAKCSGLLNAAQYRRNKDWTCDPCLVTKTPPLQICPVLFHLECSLCLFVSQVDCHNLGFVWVCTQIIGSVVLCKSAQRFFNSCFHFYETGLLSCDTQIVCVYEAPCSVVERLVVSVDVE